MDVKSKFGFLKLPKWLKRKAHDTKGQTLGPSSGPSPSTVCPIPLRSLEQKQQQQQHQQQQHVLGAPKTSIFYRVPFGRLTESEMEDLEADESGNTNQQNRSLLKFFHYQPVKKLGCGAYGTVYKAKKEGKNNETVAVKIFNVVLSEIPTLLSELYLMKALANRFPNALVEASQINWMNRTQNERRAKPKEYTVLIEMPVAKADLRSILDGTSQFEKLSMWRPEKVLDMVYQMFCDVNILHSQGWMHLDLKPENILAFKEGQEGRQEGRQGRQGGRQEIRKEKPTSASSSGSSSSSNSLVFKLADFGLSLIEDSVILTKPDSLITITYRPPEMLCPRYAYSVTPRADLWSMGIILLEIVAAMHHGPSDASETTILNDNVWTEGKWTSSTKKLLINILGWLPYSLGFLERCGIAVTNFDQSVQNAKAEEIKPGYKKYQKLWGKDLLAPKNKNKNKKQSEDKDEDEDEDESEDENEDENENENEKEKKKEKESKSEEKNENTLVVDALLYVASQLLKVDPLERWNAAQVVQYLDRFKDKVEYNWTSRKCTTVPLKPSNEPLNMEELQKENEGSYKILTRIVESLPEGQAGPKGKKGTSLNRTSLKSQVQDIFNYYLLVVDLLQLKREDDKFAALMSAILLQWGELNFTYWLLSHFRDFSPRKDLTLAELEKKMLDIEEELRKRDVEPLFTHSPISTTSTTSIGESGL